MKSWVIQLQTLKNKHILSTDPHQTFSISSREMQLIGTVIDVRGRNVSKSEQMIHTLKLTCEVLAAHFSKRNRT